jgi:hypothetical protein
MENGSLSQEKSGQSVRVTAYLHLAPGLKKK